MAGDGEVGGTYEVSFSYQDVIDTAEAAGMSFDRYDRLRDDLEGFFDDRMPDWLGTAFESAAEQYFEDEPVSPAVDGVDHAYTGQHGGTVALDADQQLDGDGEQLLYSALEYAVEKVLDHADPLEDRDLGYDVSVDEDGAAVSFSLDQ